MAPVTLAGVRKRFGASEVLHGVSLDVADGEFAALVGPSGCGKSTLLRLIAGLEGLDAGEIRIAGRRVDDLPARDRDVAMVFQNYALYPHLSVFENMAFALRVRRAPRAEVERRVRATAAVLGLADLLERFPRQLSGGQRQRVAMGRAIVRDPGVFLFDEPLSNLDAQLRVAMRSEIKALHQRVGGTTVYVTHDQIEAMTLADRIVVMRAGEVEQVGAPLELYDAPANLFVAGFIGSPAMNLIRGTIRRAGGAVLETTAGHRLALPPRLAGGAVEGDAVLGLRPQALGPGDGDASGDGGGLPVEVATVEPTGAELQIVATHGDDTVTAVVRERLALRPGDRLRLTPDLDRAHLFDAATGRVLRP